MTSQQKLIVTILSIIVMFIFVILAGLILILVQRSISEPAPASEQPAAEQPTTVQPSLTPSLTPSSTATPPQPEMDTPAQPALPTPTSTRVVTQTVTPTPRPPPINCIHAISDFEASGVITNEEVEAYLRQTIPLTHLDRCQRIKYIPKLVGMHATPAAGRFIPLVRYISVYAVQGPQGPENILATLIHEVGHNVHHNMRIDNLELANHWEELYKQDLGFVTDYARTDEFEDFAESYRAYVREPQNLLLYSPVKYEFMRVEVFAGQEYPR
jgi:hypothetical protein